MPNARDPFKRNLQFYINSFVYAKFSKLAKQKGDTMAELLTKHIEREIEKAGITLTKEENEQVLKRIQARIAGSE